MVPILELPAVRRLASPISVEVYHRMGEYAGTGPRTELLRGVVIEKMSRSPRHTILVERLYDLARRAAASNAYTRQEQPMTLADSEPEPDVAVVKGLRDDYSFAHPSTALLTIEIAVTSEELDREKASLYAEAGVIEYWIVLAERGQIEVCTAPRGGVYTRRQIYARGESVVSVALPDLRVDLEAFFSMP